MVLTAEVITVKCGGPGFQAPGNYKLQEIDNTANLMTPCQAYQLGLERSNSELLIYVHDDVTIHDPEWWQKLAAAFARSPEIAAVGLGGATRLGVPDLYKRPYRLQDMARGGYRSNQTDWQVHGEHETAFHRVVVLDAFFMAVRRDFLLRVGGWPIFRLTHHCLDLWLACEVARAGKEIWMVGVSCTHHGGGTSTKPAYREAKWLQGQTLESDHQEPHFFLYNNYRDVLPLPHVGRS